MLSYIKLIIQVTVQAVRSCSVFLSREMALICPFKSSPEVDRQAESVKGRQKTERSPSLIKLNYN